MRYLVLALLCLAPFLLPTVASQNYVTITTQVSSTLTNTYAIGSSTITSFSEPQLLVNRSFTVYSTTGTTYGCEATSFAFKGARGQHISGKVTSLNPLDFYIMTNASWQSWPKFGTCGNVPPAITSQHNTMSYSFNAALPDSGEWIIVLVNYSNSRNADGFIVAYLSLGSFIYTESLLNVTTRTILTQSLMVERVTTASGYALYLIGGIIVLIVAIALATSVAISRSKRSASRMASLYAS